MTAANGITPPPINMQSSLALELGKGAWEGEKKIAINKRVSLTAAVVGAIIPQHLQLLLFCSS